MPTPPARIRPHCEGTLGQVSPRHFRSRRRDYRVSSHDFKPGSAVAISYQHFAVASLRAVWRPSRLGNHQSRRHRAREPRSNPRETIGLRPRPGSRTHAATLATCFGVLCLSLDGRQTFPMQRRTPTIRQIPAQQAGPTELSFTFRRLSRDPGWLSRCVSTASLVHPCIRRTYTLVSSAARFRCCAGALPGFFSWMYVVVLARGSRGSTLRRCTASPCSISFAQPSS